MAVLDNFQKKGLDDKIVNYTENAVGFYKKLGYEIIGNAISIHSVGAHYVMFKKLSY